jgi:hypothetical protein
MAGVSHDHRVVPWEQAPVVMATWRVLQREARRAHSDRQQAPHGVERRCQRLLGVRQQHLPPA